MQIPLTRRSYERLPILVALTLASSSVSAKPQVSTGMRVGVAGESVDSAPWATTNLWGAIRADVLLNREGNRDFGVGPYIEVGTSGFDDVRLSGGASVLLPVHVDLPLVASAGVYAKSAAPEWRAGLSAELFWGLRSYNFHSAYAWAVGAFAGWQADVVDPGGHTILLGLHLDNTFVGLPFVMLVNWFRTP